MTIQEFDFTVKILNALLWQYNETNRLFTLLDKKQTWYDTNQTSFWSDWYTNIFDLRTANDFGLAVWSIILGLPLQIGAPPDPVDKPIFGFGSETATPNSYFNFENGNFSSESSFQLTTEEKRILLQLRYFQLISRCAIPEINQFLAYVFASYLPGKCYVLDGLDMSIEVVFTFNPGSRFLFILEKYDLIPRGAGVRIRYTIDQGLIFGFGPFYQNFENGNFIGEF